LADEEHSKRTIEVVKAEKEFLSCELARIRGFRVFPADTNFIFLDVRQSGFAAPQLREKMIKHGILVRDCSSFTGLDAFYIRVAVGTRNENERLIDAFRKALNLVD
jgi:histidinol-phosphate/aromatic aminotransferase/cobyric acid decarboxylase-like protein